MATATGMARSRLLLVDFACCASSSLRLMIAKRRRFAFAAFRFRPFDALHRVMRDGVFSQRYSNSDASEESRCRIVLPPSSRRLRSSRQAMMCARVTVRNSSGRTMPVKRIKSRIAFL